MTKDTRQKLHSVLLGLCQNVYFQPPANIKLKYPCIIYNLSDKISNAADDEKYIKHDLYTLTVIDKDPETELPDKILDSFGHSSFDRWYAADGLNHYALRIYI